MDKEVDICAVNKEKIILFLIPVMEKIAGVINEVMTKMYDALMEYYRREGAIYGDHDEGLMRYLDELAEIKRLEGRIESIKEHQAILKDLFFEKNKRSVKDRKD